MSYVHIWYQKDRLRRNRDNGHNHIRRARERRRYNPSTFRIEDTAVFPPEFSQFVEQMIFGTPFHES
ncbi:12707_t:CDS:2 [Racocetra fulgida]|uniref:12707_t:CDS:1 n=1 Tax=Racocetra fulgida TaxID=60492 RepID=A0A9N9CD13_9GLOM|nr:12707_t:CDS:2 [Racocetra fulgida]